MDGVQLVDVERKQAREELTSTIIFTRRISASADVIQQIGGSIGVQNSGRFRVEGLW